jgi:hypothetical protein
LENLIKQIFQSIIVSDGIVSDGIIVVDLVHSGVRRRRPPYPPRH